MAEVEIIQNPSYEQVMAYWRQLSGVSRAAIFIKEPWVSPWYKLISQHHSPQLILIKNPELVAIAILHRQVVWLRHVFRRQHIFLNEMPLFGNNMVIEYNGLLCRDGHEAMAWSVLCEWLAQKSDWHELRLNTLDNVNFAAALAGAKQQSLIVHDIETQTAPLIKFNEHSDWAALESVHFSANRLYQIRRCIKLYEKNTGSIELSVAKSSLDRAHAWSELERLHSHYWQGKGKAGSFSNPQWKAFHESIDAAYVQLVSIKAGTELIGVLYNLEYQGRIYNIQSGFVYPQDNKYKPGLLSHYLCAKYNYELKANSYEFLGGGEHYKRSIAKHTHELAWVRIRNPAKSYWFENLVAKLYRNCRAYVLSWR